MTSVLVQWLADIVSRFLLLTATIPSVVCTTMRVDSTLRAGLLLPALLIVGLTVVTLKVLSITHCPTISVFRRSGTMVIHWLCLHGATQLSVLHRAQVLTRLTGLLMTISTILIGVIRMVTSAIAALLTTLHLLLSSLGIGISTRR